MASQNPDCIEWSRGCLLKGQKHDAFSLTATNLHPNPSLFDLKPWLASSAPSKPKPTASPSWCVFSKYTIKQHWHLTNIESRVFSWAPAEVEEKAQCKGNEVEEVVAMQRQNSLYCTLEEGGSYNCKLKIKL